MSSSRPFDELLDLLKVLVHQPSVVGAEMSFFRTLRRELEDTGVKVTQYDGLLVAEGDRPEHCLVSAHIDRHGLVCTGPGEFQYAAFVAQHKGDQQGDSVSEQTFATVSARLNGESVIAYEPWSGGYLAGGEISDAHLCPRRRNMVFAVGGMDHVPAGAPVAFRDRLRMKEGWIQAQLDNVLTVAMLIHLFRQGYRGTGFFSAQEEAGRSWRYILEWFRRHDRTTDRLLVLDTSPFPDRDAASAQQVVLRRRDANAQFSPAAVDMIEAVCRRRGVDYRFKGDYVEAINVQRAAEGRPPMSYGRTELGRIIVASEGAVQGATLQVPTTGYHTPSETASIDACRAYLGVLSELTLD